MGPGQRPALRTAPSFLEQALFGRARSLLAASKQAHGSGWGILAYEPTGRRLLILQAENHQDLTIWGVRPLLVIDVWEHAYYLQYENRRGEYLDKIFMVIDWPAVSARYAEAIS